MSIYRDIIKESKIRSVASFEFDYDKIMILSDILILKLEKNKLKKEDRDLLIELIYMMETIRSF